MKLDRFIEAERVALDKVLAEIEAEARPTPDEIEAYCQKCSGIKLPCLHRQTWKPNDGLLEHCPDLRTVFGGEWP